MKAIIIACLATLLTACASTQPVTDQAHSAITGAATVRDVLMIFGALP